jgi:uncharacterized protein YheU (UPF0270 family)
MNESLKNDLQLAVSELSTINNKIREYNLQEYTDEDLEIYLDQEQKRLVRALEKHAFGSNVTTLLTRHLS